MKEFSYALEFYRDDIFDLDNINIFKIKTEEAKKIEMYFSKFISNVEVIRPYIIMSYKFDKKIGYKNRIRYIRGLIYASDYIDYIDIQNIPKDIDYFKEIGLTEIDLEKQSIWGYTSYIEDDNYESIISGSNDEISKIVEEIEIDNNPSSDDLSDEQLKSLDNNIIELDKDMMNTLIGYLNKDENNNKTEVQSYISIEEKVFRFKKCSKIYIENIIKDRLKRNLIKEEDVYMIKKAMRAWFKKMFYILDRIIEFNNKELEYKDKNPSRFL